MSLFLAALPVWVAALLVVVLPTALAMCGPLLIRRHYGLERLATNNEIAGFKFATVGVLYAVMLAFAIIIVWERFSDAEAAVVQEAGAAATVYRLAAGPEPQAGATRAALTNYLELVMARDWPQMALEKEDHEVTRALDDLYAATLSLAQSASRPQAVLLAVFNQLDSVTQARRARLHLAHGIVPTNLWVVLVLGGMLTVGFTFFLRDAQPAGPDCHDRDPDPHRIHGPVRDRLDRSPLHRPGAHQRRPAAHGARGLRSAG